MVDKAIVVGSMQKQATSRKLLCSTGYIVHAQLLVLTCHYCWLRMDIIVT